MNVYLIEDDGGVTVFDAGIADDAAGAERRRGRLGGIRRVVLGHADADHRGARAGARRAGLLPPARARGGRVAGHASATTGTRKLDARAVPSLWLLIGAGTAARSRSRAPSPRATRWPGFRVSSCPATRPD